MKAQTLALALAQLIFISSAFASVVHVQKGATGVNDGSSWTNAFTDLQTAINSAAIGDEVWVAVGTYKPNDPNPTNVSREQWFQMKNGVAIYGGFAGTETTLTQRNPAANPTILSGDLNGDDADADGDGFPDAASMSDNTYHVFYNDSTLALDATAVLDGFTIRGGNAVGADYHNIGGAIKNSESSPTISNCLITANRAGDCGGGIYSIGSSPEITGCTFIANSAVNSGGGVYVYSGAAVLQNCTFQGNLAVEAFGGAMYDIYDSSTLTNCTIVGNHAWMGGGLYSYCVTTTVTNCIIWGNTTNSSSSQLDGPPAVQNCVVEGGYASGVNIVTADPLLLPLAQYGGPTPTKPLAAGSPAIDAGATGGGIPATDQRGFARDAVPDIGACEAQQSSVLTVGIAPASVMENAGAVATTLTVTRSGSTTANLMVNLFHDGGSIASIPESVTIPAGQATATVNVGVNDNSETDGNKTVQIVAWAGGLMEGMSVLTVVDNDSNHIAAGDVSGTWPASPLPYFVSGGITIPSGSSLTIEAGATVVFNKGAAITIWGTFNVQGTELAPVSFRSAASSPQFGDWNGLGFYEDSSGLMQWAVIEHADTGMSCDGASPTLDHLIIRNNLAYGIYIRAHAYGCSGSYAAPTISDCEIYDNGDYGVIYYGSGSSISGCIPARAGVVSGTLTRCSIHHNLGGISIVSYSGYHAYGVANPTIDHCNIYNNAGRGIVTSGDCYVSATIMHCLIRDNNGTGIYFGASAGSPSVRNCIITGNDEGVSAGTGAQYGLSYNNVWSNNSTDFGAGLGDIGVMTHLNHLGNASDLFFNISQNPLFVDADGPDNDPLTAVDNNYHLQSASPCIDAGNPSDPFDAEPENNGDLANMGLYGNTSGATTSVLGRPVFTAVPDTATGGITQTFSFDFNSDAEGSGGTYSIAKVTPALSGASINPATGSFSWTPALANSGSTHYFFVSITKGGLVRVARWTITLTSDADGDGMNDQWEADNGFNYGDPSDAALDADGDGLSNLAECLAGTNPRELWVLARPGDFNGGGKADLLWRNSTGAAIWLMNGIAVAGSGGIYNGNTDWSVAHVADFNGDGKDDLLWRNITTGAHAMWLMNGLTTIGGDSVYTPDAGWRILACGDYNGDGCADLLWRNSADGEVVIFAMNGTVVAGSKYVLQSGSGWTPVPVVVDLDGDGTDDILWTKDGGSDVAAWLMAADLSVKGGGTIYSYGPSYSLVVDALGDFNGDGKTDLVWRNASNSDTVIWLMNGITVTGAGSVFPGSTAWVPVAAADLDGNGKDDVLWRNSSDGDYAVYMMNCTADTVVVASGAVIYSYNTDWTVVYIADFDGDGKGDLVWRSTGSGGCVLWLMDGFTVKNFGTLY